MNRGVRPSQMAGRVVKNGKLDRKMKKREAQGETGLTYICGQAGTLPSGGCITK